MSVWKFAVVSAVSREDQATEDKDSLNYQLRTARTYGERMGGTFTKEYRAEGFSRSGYFDLTHALREIPVFDELAKDAKHHQMDVILLESYDRLGDLGFMLFNYLSFIGAPYIQLRSVQQALPIEDPKIYKPRQDDSTVMMINNSLTINRYRTSKIVRAFTVGIAKRVQDGNYSRRVPVGYSIQRDTDGTGHAVPDERAAVIQHFADQFLQGYSYAEITRRANETGIYPAGGRWWDTIIRRILENPFYAGRVFDGRHVDANTPLLDGKHQALWSWETFERLQAEIQRRAPEKYAVKQTHPFSCLIKCAVCGRWLWAFTSQWQGRKYLYWRCRGHVQITREAAREKIVTELERLFRNAPEPSQEAPGRTKTQTTGIVSVERQIARLDAAYYAETSVMSPDEYNKSLGELKRKREKLLQDQQAEEVEQARRAEAEQMRVTLREMVDMGMVGYWIDHTDPVVVRSLLARVVSITAERDKTIQVEWV